MSNQQESASKGWIIIITSIIGVIGTITVAYFAFRGAIFPAQLEIQASQTAQSILSTQIANSIWITQTAHSVEVSLSSVPPSQIPSPTNDSVIFSPMIIPTATFAPPPTITSTQPIPHEEYVDSSTVEQDMHVCPIGFAIAGVREDRNQFLCRRVMRIGEEKFVVTVLDPGTALTARSDMHACPLGMYLRGLRIDRNDLLCSYDGRNAPPNEWQIEFSNNVSDPGSVGYDMHICPASTSSITYLTGIRADQNRFLCAIHQP